eukprot:TRINITY_DN14789_c0_g1_i1.p1 TRINITY_DN14789_c0_g1~~TRINITY_DN14789_c0_g1_i1.p1  ORF type:complete len:374 (-),score=44.07 TRINITY_DN14789_c0_g1_i1:50-1171(-)
MQQVALTLLAHPTISLVSLGGATALKLGAGRALAVALKSRFSRAAHSVRAPDMAKICHFVDALLQDRKADETQQYVLVKGEMGIGKSTALKAALGKRCGVLNVSVLPGYSCQIIIDKVLLAFTNARTTIETRAAVAKRVMFFYRLMFFSRPIVILEAAEVQPGQKPSDVLAAARELTKIGFVVVIDSSPNSLPSYSNLRAHPVSMEPLLWAQTVEIPELAVLVSELKSAGLLEHVQFIIGTNLARLFHLQRQLRARTHGDTVAIVTNFLMTEIREMMENLVDLRRKIPHINDPLQQIAQGAQSVPWEYSLPVPCKLLRQKFGADQIFPVNVTAHCAIYLSYNCAGQVTKNRLDMYVKACVAQENILKVATLNY